MALSTWLAAAVLIAGVAWPIRRSLRLSLTLEDRRLIVINRWRSHTVEQSDIEDVVEKPLGGKGPTGIGLHLRGRQWPSALLLEATATFDVVTGAHWDAALRTFLGPARLG